MIARENAQAARIDRQALGEPVFGGEIGDQFAVGGADLPCARAHRRPRTPAVQRQVARIGGGLSEGGLRDAAEHQHRVVAALPPQRRVQAAEHGAHNRFPTP